MKDVAKLANVSITTVYRVIHKNGYVKEETQKAIEEAIKSLNYYPNNVGRSLNKNLVNIIAVIAPVGRGEIENDPYYLNILSGIEHELADSGIDILLSTQRPKFNGDTFYLDYCKPFLERKADGLIILNGTLTQRDYDIIKNRKVPVCMISEYPDKEVTDYVDVNNYNSFKTILNEIYKKGHRKIGFGGYTSLSKSINQRFLAYKDFILEKDLKFKEDYILKTDTLIRNGSNVFKEFLSLEDRPTAIAFSTDNIAVEAFLEAKKCGFNIPKDLSITGFDGTNISRFMTPSLFTVEQPLFQMGKMAAQLLVERIKNKSKKYETVFFDTNLKIGDSLFKLEE